MISCDKIDVGGKCSPLAATDGHSTRHVSPTHGSSGGRTSAAATPVVATLESAPLSRVVATLDPATVAEIASLDSVTVSGVVALLDSATANPASSEADIPAVSRTTDTT